MDTSKKDITSIGTTEIVKGEFVFLPLEDGKKCEEFIRRFAEFIGEKHSVTLEGVQHLVDVAFEGVSPITGQPVRTKAIIRVEKISPRWTLWDDMCYRLWIPWGIRQRYLIETTDKKRYVISFNRQDSKFFSPIEAALHNEAMKLNKGFIACDVVPGE